MGYIKKTDLNKAWTKKRSYTRTQAIIKTLQNIFLIYCEGKNTEPIYFKSFPVNSETIVESIGLGRSRTALVQHILKLLNDNKYLEGQDNFDEDRQIWCVFDKDTKGEDNEDDDFNNAIQLANENGLKVAYSNDAFELWFILHDKYLDVQQNRKQYFEYLSQKFGLNYNEIGKCEDFSSTLYSLYLDKQKDAIRNAKKLHDFHKEEINYCKHFPCTTVYILVEELNKCLKK
jgi:hypothetical protein